LRSRIVAEALVVLKREVILLVRKSMIDAAVMKCSPPSSESVLFSGNVWEYILF
jgi:hypothetical protein